MTARQCAALCLTLLTWAPTAEIWSPTGIDQRAGSLSTHVERFYSATVRATQYVVLL